MGMGTRLEAATAIRRDAFGSLDEGGGRVERSG